MHMHVDKYGNEKPQVLNKMHAPKVKLCDETFAFNVNLLYLSLFLQVSLWLTSNAWDLPLFFGLV